MSLTPALQGRLNQAARFLAVNRTTGAVFAMVILVGLGEKMAERFVPVYLMALGGGAMAVGLLQAMDNFLSALYVYPGGYLADRVGTKKALLVFNLIAMAGFALAALIPSWQAVLAGAVLFISWSAISLPATMTLMYRVLPKTKRTMGVSIHAMVRRIPMAAGPVLGGLFILAWGEQTGVRLAFGAAFVLSLVALVFQQRMIADDPTPGKEEAPASRDRTSKAMSMGPARLFSLMGPTLKKLLVADILIRFCEQMPYAFVVVWCMKTMARPVSALEFGLLTAIEMATAILVYIPVAYLADKGGKKPFILVSFIFFTLFPLTLLASQDFTWLVLAFIIRGLQEFGEPSRKALIMDLSPAHCRGAMFGLYYLIRDILVAGAALLGALVWAQSPEICLITAALFGTMGTAWFAFSGASPSPHLSTKGKS